MLADLGRWNLSQPGKFVDGRFRDAQKVSHLRYGEDVAIHSAIAVCWFIRCCQQSIVHIECRIGPISEKLKLAFLLRLMKVHSYSSGPQEELGHERCFTSGADNAYRSHRSA